MVRLKAILLNQIIYWSDKFQFLMVRLKGSSKKEVAGNIYISIPYGAIKSRISVIVEEIRIIISIPYGAIKSFCK